jgi:hypothetical protein
MMSGEPSVVRPARILVAGYAAWAVVVGVWGPHAQAFPEALQHAAGIAVAAVCVIAAVHPGGWLRWAFVAVAGYAMWSVARVIATEEYTSSTTLAGVASYVMIAMAALTTEATTAVLEGIDAAAKVHEADE